MSPRRLRVWLDARGSRNAWLLRWAHAALRLATGFIALNPRLDPTRIRQRLIDGLGSGALGSGAPSASHGTAFCLANSMRSSAVLRQIPRNMIGVY